MKLFADNLSIESAVNKAGRQRMLSQRMVSSYYQIAMSVSPEVAKENLTNSINLFESQLAVLKAYAKDKNLNESLTRVETIWLPLKAIVTGEVDTAHATRLYYLSEDLLYASHRVVQLIQDKANYTIANVINIAGRQRMLSQKLTKLYLLRGLGFDLLSIKDEIQLANRDFNEALTMLSSFSDNSDLIDKELAEVNIQWEWFQQVLQQSSQEDFHLLLIDASETILTSMETITALYEQQGSN